MRIFQPTTDHYITCPACFEPLEWEDSDLEIDPSYPQYYYVVCPICKEKIYFMKNEWLDKEYRRYHK